MSGKLKFFYAIYSSYEIAKFFKLSHRLIGSRIVRVFLSKLFRLKNFEILHGHIRFAKNLSISKEAIPAMKLQNFSSYFITRIGLLKVCFSWHAGC